MELWGAVVPAECAHNIISSKVEFKLKKAKTGQWSALESSTPVTVPTQHPGTKKNWEKLLKEQPEEKPEGDAALQAVFQQIYANGSEEQRRAMIKLVPLWACL